MEIYFVIGGLSLITGFLSGLLGIGGGIVLGPLLLYVPPLFGLEPLAMRDVAGLTIIQGLLACLGGILVHRKFQFVSDKLSLCMGTTIFIAAGVGGAASGFIANDILVFIFACLAFAAAILMIKPVRNDPEKPDTATVRFQWSRAVSVASGVGLLGGMVGQGGSFILIPLMIFYVKIPTRIAIGSNLAIVMLSSLAAFISKAATGQIQWIMTIPIVLMVLPFAVLGGYVSSKVSVLWLRRILACLIAAAALWMWFSLLC
ncbi:MAG: sulfite exporter TauE/SafE family protein [Proteobacteria bacterium]|nr:sulfite exporter TauE/SafE family protein [Pseudomonadota bacterium]MBU1584218.1 sulfite exporter TauE/SafE family protein [Pseudomonadota bacterium]MBU2629915.1 sulfite exporter TauE/SafE family protein [Pseudomonadota bacterium]